MRISTSQIHQQGVRSIVDRQLEVAKAQQQLASGRRILSPSDDPIGSARLLGLRERIAATEQYQKNIALAVGRLSVEESALQGVGEVLQRVQELVVQGSNAPLSAGDRRSVALEIRHLSDQLRELANVSDGNGEYLFAGFKARTEPFAPAPDGGMVYQGDQGRRLLQIGPSRQIAVGDSGAEVFQWMRNGNGSFRVAAEAANTGTGTIAVGSVTDPTAFQGHRYRIEFTAADTFDVIDETTSTTVLAGQTYSDGTLIRFDGLETAIRGAPAAGDRFTVQPAEHQDVFATLQNVIRALEAPADTPARSAQLNQSLNNALADLDQGLDHLRDMRVRVGTRLNALEGQEYANQDFNLYMQRLLGEVEGLDYAEAASRLNQEALALQAAQQSFVRIQGLSLFNYL